MTMHFVMKTTVICHASCDSVLMCIVFMMNVGKISATLSNKISVMNLAACFILTGLALLF